MGNFDQKDVDLMIAVSVLSDQTKRVEARLAEIENKLDDNAERLTKLETVSKQAAKSSDRWMGWAAAIGLMVIELVLRFAVV